MRLLPTVTIIALISNCAMAASPSAQRGLTIARTYCARCHSIDKVSESPLKIAPPFRTLHQRYPVTDLEEPLGEGIVTGHPTMPEFRFEPDQIHDFIEFLKTLEWGAAARSVRRLGCAGRDGGLAARLHRPRLLALGPRRRIAQQHRSIGCGKTRERCDPCKTREV